MPTYLFSIPLDNPSLVSHWEITFSFILSNSGLRVSCCFHTITYLKMDSTLHESMDNTLSLCEPRFLLCNPSVPSRIESEIWIFEAFLSLTLPPWPPQIGALNRKIPYHKSPHILHLPFFFFFFLITVDVWVSSRVPRLILGD